MDNVIIVSSDSHAGMPKDLWSEYLDPRYHDLLPQLREDNEVYPRAIYVLSSKRATVGMPDIQEAHRTGWHGLHDPVLRLADMDREGVAAELIYHGDFRLGDLFHNATNRQYPFEVWDAGARAWNRWAADTFGFATDRFLLTGAIGPCTDMESTVADLEWIADHGFAGTFCPGFMRHAGTPPLFDKYWEPFWSLCEDRGIAIVVHAGYGVNQGVVFPQLERILNDVSTAAGGSSDLEELVKHNDAVSQESSEFFTNFTNSTVQRRPMWQLMLGGVFDRHPNLKLMLTEIRMDWIPATLAPSRLALRRAPQRAPGGPPAERVLAHQLPGRCLLRAQGRGGDAPRARRRDDPLRPGLPAPRGNLAQHAGVAPRRLWRRAGRRAPSDAG